MTAGEIKTKVKELLANGTPKAAIFQQLQNQGIKDQHLANLVAMQSDPDRYQNNIILVYGFVIAFIILMLSVLVSLFGADDEFAAAFGQNFLIATEVIIVLFGLLFTWGFLRPIPGAYNAFIFLTIWGYVQTIIRGGELDPTGLVINILAIFFAWYVRSQLFPDFGFFGARKNDHGEYIFTDWRRKG